MTTTNNRTRMVNIWVGTPYLHAPSIRELDLADRIVQCANFNMEPDAVESGFASPPDGYAFDLTSPNALPLTRPHLLIAGSSRDAERAVGTILRGSGLIVARYSIFHGGPSGYSGCMPAAGGYALDIPKNVNAVRRLLGHSGFLDGLLARDESMIRSALEDLSAGGDAPFIATPYLSSALRIP